MMKRLMCVLFALLLCLTAACGKGKAKEEPAEITLSLPVSQTFVQTIGQEETTNRYRFDWEDPFIREDGYIEVKGECRNTDSGDTEICRLLYAPDGMPVGDRRFRTSGPDMNNAYDSVYMLDMTWESYLAGLTGVDRAKDGRIEYEDGRYEKVKLEGYRILSIETYTEDDRLTSEFTYNEYGQIRKFAIYDDSGTEWLNSRFTYEEITVTRKAP